MEAGAILNMVEYAFRSLCFIIDFIVRDYYSTIRTVLKHPSIGYQGQVIN